jgi:uncharacterized protein
MAIKVDLEYIKEMGTERERENWEFRTFLKQHTLTSREIDAIVHEIVDEVTSQIDCTKCANCCKQIKPVLDEEDVSKFAQGLKVPVSEFDEQYLCADDENPSKHNFNELPCPFLKKDQCTNYDHRPKECRSYPHLHKKDFVSRLWGVVENYELCPIVFNVYEQLKAELWNNDWFDEDDFDYDWV